MARLVLGTDINNTGTSSFVRDVSPDYYIEWTCTNKKISKGAALLNFGAMPEGTVINDTYAFAYAYYKNKNVSGLVDLTKLGKSKNATKNYSFYYAFAESTITGVKLPDVISGDSCFANAFQNCKDITGKLDFSNVVTIWAPANGNVLSSTFNGCTGITSVDLSNLNSRNCVGLGMSYMFSGCTNLSSVDFKEMQFVCYQNYMFQNCSSLSSINLSNVRMFANNNSIFSGCTSLESIDLNNVCVTSLNSAFNNCTNLNNISLGNLSGFQTQIYRPFSGCTSLKSISFPKFVGTILDLSSLLYGVTDCTVHFPSDLDPQTGSTVVSSLIGYPDFGGTNITLAFDLNPTNGIVDLSKLIEVPGYVNTQFYQTYKDLTNITKVDLSNLVCIGTNIYNDFGNAMSSYWFSGCTNLTKIDISSLSYIGNYNGIFSYAFGGTSITDLYFPALKGIYTMSGYNQKRMFQNMLSGCTGVTLHFPKDFDQQIITGQNGYPNFGGTNTVILFDLPSIKALTGVDTNTYSRNPKYDTSTVLAWKKGDYKEFDLTPYYTSTLNDPQVGDTIYSDPECTTAVTTISSIA